MFSKQKHLYDKVKVDSEIEKKFAKDLDVHKNVEMYVKLPGGFFINTPVGKYNPDWAIVLNEVNQKHIYFIAETKGTSDNITLNLKGVENAKIESARQHFKVISNNEVTYDVVDSYEKLIDKLSVIKRERIYVLFLYLNYMFFQFCNRNEIILLKGYYIPLSPLIL